MTRISREQTIALVFSALMVLSVAAAGVALGADVQRGGDSPTFNPGVGGPNQVVVSEDKPVVFQGEDDIEFVDDNGNPVDPSNLIGVSGNAEGIPLESPIPQDQEQGQYAINGRAQNPGVTVQTPRVTDLEVLNERGIDVEGSSVQEDETLLISAEWNFQNAEDLSLTVTDENGNEITGDVLTQVGSLSDAQRQELTGLYAQNPEKVANPGQRGTGTGIEYLQGLGQFNQSQLADNASVEAAYWAIDLSDQDAGDYTITVDGWDNLDFGSATRSTTVSLTTENDIALDMESDEATRGQNVRYTVRGSTAGAQHLVAIEGNDFRNNQVDERVFRDVDDVIDRGTNDTDGDGNADFAWARLEVDEDTGIAQGQIDTTYLDDSNVDINLYNDEQTLENVSANLGDTEDDKTLSVEQGTLTFSSPAGTYTAGQEVDVSGQAPQGIDDVAIYARDQGDWELVDVNEDGQLSEDDLVSVDADGEFEENDVTLSQASDILSIPGRYRIGVVEAEDARGDDGELSQTLTTSQFSSATSEQTSIIVSEPGLGQEEPSLGGGNDTNLSAAFGLGSTAVNAAQQENETDNDTAGNQTPADDNPTYVFRTINNQVAVEDGTVEVSGVAPGLQEVLVVMVDSRGRTVTETVSVDDNDVFEEDDIELITQEGRELNEGEITAFVFGLGRDTVAGDGVLPGQQDAEIADLENYIQSFGTGLTQEQITARILDETIQEPGSDDLFVRQEFRYSDAATSVEGVLPSDQNQPGLQSQIESIEAGQDVTIEGITNRRPDDNTISVEVIDGPSADQFDSASTDDWGRNGVWSVNLSTEGVQPGTYTLEVDDGDNTDIVQFEVVEPGQAQETTTAEAGQETTEVADGETTVADGGTTTVEEDEEGNESGAGELNTLEVRSANEDDTIVYTLAVDGDAQVVRGINETAAEEQLAQGSLTARTSGSDVFEFSGQITQFTVEGNATVLLNGEEVEPDAVANATAGNSSSLVAPSL